MLMSRTSTNMHYCMSLYYVDSHSSEWPPCNTTFFLQRQNTWLAAVSPYKISYLPEVPGAPWGPHFKRLSFEWTIPLIFYTEYVVY